MSDQPEQAAICLGSDVYHMPVMLGTGVWAYEGTRCGIDISIADDWEIVAITEIGNHRLCKRCERMEESDELREIREALEREAT